VISKCIVKLEALALSSHHLHAHLYSSKFEVFEKKLVIHIPYIPVKSINLDFQSTQKIKKKIVRDHPIILHAQFGFNQNYSF
jgi:hypothetical protein